MLKSLLLVTLFASAAICFEPLNQTSFNEQALNTHNQYRFLHGAPALKLNNELSQIALTHALDMAKLDRVVHNEPEWKKGLIGESANSINDLETLDGIAATEQWYSPISKYDSLGELSKRTTSFTQLVWNSSQEVGFGIARNAQGTLFYVATYWPKGNVDGKYDDNVFQMTMKDLSLCDKESKRVSVNTLKPSIQDIQTLETILNNDKIKDSVIELVSSLSASIMDSLHKSINVIKDIIHKNEDLSNFLPESQASATKSSVVTSPDELSTSEQTVSETSSEMQTQTPVDIKSAGKPLLFEPSKLVKGKIKFI